MTAALLSQCEAALRDLVRQINDKVEEQGGEGNFYTGAALDTLAAIDAHRTQAGANRPAGDEQQARDGCHGLDTPERVRFYEHDFYPLSNFSAFRVTVPAVFGSLDFDTSEAAYHYFKFIGEETAHIRGMIRRATSAHDAFKIAEAHKGERRSDWDDVKLDVMRGILRAKVEQHEYVRRKLLATGNRELVEDSWRDDYWGWGPNRDGKNMLGKLWMEIRAELRAAIAAQQEPKS